MNNLTRAPMIKQMLAVSRNVKHRLSGKSPRFSSEPTLRRKNCQLLSGKQSLVILGDAVNGVPFGHGDPNVGIVAETTDVPRSMANHNDRKNVHYCG